MNSAILVAVVGVFVYIVHWPLERYIIGNTKRRRLIQDDILSHHETLAKDSIYYRLIITDENRLKKMFKLLPATASGILFINGDDVFLDAKAMKGEKLFQRVYKKLGVRAVLHTKKEIAPWIEIPDGNESLYISCDTGLTIIGRDRATQQLFDHINNKVTPTQIDFDTEQNKSKKYALMFFVFILCGTVLVCILRIREIDKNTKLKRDGKQIEQTRRIR